jgi:methionyl aminopeptidase
VPHQCITPAEKINMLQRNDTCWCGSGKKYKKCHLREDSARKTKAADKPRNRMVKTSEEIEGMRRAGRFNGQLLDYVRPFVAAGISTKKIDMLVHERTAQHGHRPASLGYHGFPASVCTSINNVVCHGIPSEKEILKDGDIVNIDLTTIVDGFHGDSSETFMIGAVSAAARHLVQVSAQAMLLGIRAAGPGRHLRLIGETIEPFVNAQGCSVVRQYTGHGIGRKFHEFFTVYHHVDPECDNVILEPGMTLTVEPMINAGAYPVTTDVIDKWTVRTKDGSLSAQFEHTILITDTGAEILTLTPSEREKGVIVEVPGIVLPPELNAITNHR